MFKARRRDLGKLNKNFLNVKKNIYKNQAEYCQKRKIKDEMAKYKIIRYKRLVKI